MIFNYDKENGTFNNSKNLSDVKQSIIDFFTKKQDIKKNYVLTDKDNDFFKRFRETFSSDQISGSSEKDVAYAKQLVDQYADQKQGIYDLIEAKGLLGVTEANLADAQSTTIQGMTKFQSVAKSAVTAVKSFVGTLGNMAIAMAASWAIGKAIEGIDYLIHYDENIIKAGQEAKDSIDSTFKSFEEGKQSIMDLGSSFGNQTEQIKNTGDAIDQVAEKYVELRKGVNQNTNENVSLSTDEYQQYIDLSSKLASQFPGLVAGYDSQGNAVLNLASNADKAADSIRNLYEAQVSSANVDMGKNLQATYDGDLSIAAQLIDNGSVDIEKGTDGLVSAIERYKKTVAEAKSDTTLASVLGDSDNEISSSIDSLQSDISSLSDTLTKLKTGEFKDSDLTDLIQQFPQLADQTDNLQEAISNLQADKLKSTLKKIDDSMDGASDEELANAQKLKDSLIKSVDLSDINSDKITESINCI